MESETVHFPTPTIGPGSTVMTVIAELVREARKREHAASVLVERWRTPGLADGEVRPASSPVFPNGRRGSAALALDYLTGNLVHRRIAVERLYASALTEVELPADARVLLHDGSYAYGGVHPLAARHPAAPLYYYSHIPLSRSVRRGEARALSRHLNAWIFVSQYLADRFEARVGANVASVAVVPNGVDTEVFAPRSGDLVEEPVILWTGKVTAEKGPHLILRALARLQRGDWTLRIVGGGWYSPTQSLSSYEQELRQLATKVAGRVEFLGFVPHDEIAGYLRSTRVFCFPSTWDEPFGLALLEAMSCGLACVASPRGGIPEFAGDAVIYADPADDEQLAAALDGLLGSPQEVESLGRRARARALGFSTAAQYEQLDAVLTRFG